MGIPGLHWCPGPEYHLEDHLRSGPWRWFLHWDLEPCPGICPQDNEPRRCRSGSSISEEPLCWIHHEPEGYQDDWALWLWWFLVHHPVVAEEIFHSDRPPKNRWKNHHGDVFSSSEEREEPSTDVEEWIFVLLLSHELYLSRNTIFCKCHYTRLDSSIAMCLLFINRVDLLISLPILYFSLHHWIFCLY